MQHAPNGTTAEWLGRGNCLTAGLSSGSTHDFSEAESSTLLCRLTGCHLESTFSTDVIIQYLKGNSKTPMQDGAPSGLWKVYCLATTFTVPLNFIFFCCKYISKQVCLDFFFFFFYPFKIQTNEKGSKTQSCLVTECLVIPMGPCQKSRLKPSIHHYALPYKKTDFSVRPSYPYLMEYSLLTVIHCLWFYVS